MSGDKFYFLSKSDRLAVSVLLFLVFLAPFATIFYNSVQTNSIVALGQIIVFILLFSSSVRTVEEVFKNKKNILTTLFLISFVALVLAGFIKNGGTGRSFFYFANILFFFSLIYVFRQDQRNFAYLCVAKILSVALVCIIFVAFRVVEGESYYDYVLGAPDIYRNIRHLNYDLMICTGGLFYLALSDRGRGVKFYIPLLFFSVFLFWSGGRGQLVALFVFLFFMLFSGFRSLSLSVFPVLALALLLVIISGETNFLFGQMEKSLESASVNGISSDRLRIWSEAWNDGLTGGLLGHGADSFRQFTALNIVHPHNSIIQFMFEYGVIGLLLILVFLSVTSLIIIRLVFINAVSDSLKMLSSFILSMYAYSLVDGIFYHAIPFSFMVMVAAVFFVELRRSDRKAC